MVHSIRGPASPDNRKLYLQFVFVLIMKGIKWERWWMGGGWGEGGGMAEGRHAGLPNNWNRNSGVCVCVGLLSTQLYTYVHVSVVCLEHHLKTSAEREKRKKNIQRNVLANVLYIMEAAKRKSSVFREEKCVIYDHHKLYGLDKILFSLL